MSLDLTRRSVKGTPLDATEYDGNLDKMENAQIAAQPYADRAAAEAAAVPTAVQRIAYLDWAGRVVDFVREPAGASGTAPLTTNSASVNWIPASRATPQHFDDAVGDGSADVQTAVEACFDWVNAQGGGDAPIPRGAHPHANPIRLRPLVNVLAEGSSFENASPAVIWDYSGSSYAFYADEVIGAPDLFLGKILHTSATGTNDTDAMHFKKGLSAARINASFLISGATQNGIVIWGHDPDDNTANNNSYRTQIQFISSAGGGSDAPGYCIWYRSDTDALNTRGNAHYVGPATRLDGFTNGIKTNGQGNVFEGLTINGPMTGSMFEFEGDQILGNLVVGVFNDFNATGDIVKINNTSSAPRDVVTFISPVNRVAAADVNDVSTGGGDAYVFCIQSGRGSDPFPGRSTITTIKNGVETNFLPDRFKVDEAGTIALGDSATFPQTGVRSEVPTSGSVNQNAMVVDAVPSDEATGAITGLDLRGEGADGSYTTAALYGLRVNAFTAGTGQTITDSYGVRVEGAAAVATTNYAFFANFIAADGYNFYANGNAPNYFAGNTGVGVEPAARLHVDGTVRLDNLPTTDPSVAGQLWNDAGTLKVSAG